MYLQRSLILSRGLGQQSDSALVARCQKADITAFNEIVSRYKGKIYNYLYRMTGNAEDAEDQQDGADREVVRQADGHLSGGPLARAPRARWPGYAVPAPQAKAGARCRFAPARRRAALPEG